MFKEESVWYECKGCGHFAFECANKKNKKVTKGRAMTTTWDDDSDESDDESQCSEDEFLQKVRAFMVFTERVPEVSLSESEEEYDESEEQDDKGEEDLQDPYTELYNKSIQSAKTNKELKKIQELIEKSNYQEQSLLQVQSSSPHELEGNDSFEESSFREINEELNLKVIYLDMKLNELNKMLFHENEKKRRRKIKIEMF